LSALAAFPEHIRNGTTGSSITLKYPCRDPEGPMYWAGIRAAKESPEVWISLCKSGHRIPTFGVSLHEGREDEFLEDHTFPEDTTMKSFLAQPLRWIESIPLTIAPPATYEVCYFFFNK